MLAINRDIVPWRERAFVTIAEAAQIVARSPDWIRNRIGEGRLSCARLSTGGPVVVCVPTLILLIEKAVPVCAKEAASRPRLSKPRLVVSNS